MRRSVIIAQFWRPEVTRIGKFSRNFCVFRKNDKMIKFSNFCSESLHRYTDRRCCVQNSWKLSDGKSVKACVIYLTKKQTFFGSLSNCGYCADRAQSLPWPAPDMWLTTFQISSKSVHFRRTYSRPREGRSKCAIKHFQVPYSAKHSFSPSKWICLVGAICWRVQE